MPARLCSNPAAGLRYGPAGHRKEALALLPLLLALFPLPFATPGATADAGIVACTSSASRGGIPVVVVSAPESPWAVVQLHVRIAGEGVSQDLRAHSEALGHALAEGAHPNGRPGAREKVAAVHGETRVLVDEDAIVISDGVPAGSLDTALSALDQRLAGRRRLVPASSPLPRLEGEGRVPLVVRQALAPAHPYAQPLTVSEAPDPAKLVALADAVLRREGVVVVVIGPEPEARLRARALRALKTSLPTGARAPVSLTTTPGARVVEDVTLPSGPRGLFSWLWWQTPGLRAATPADRAAYRALAALLGAEHGQGDAAGFLSWHVPLTSPAGAEAAEARRLERLEAVASGEIPDDDVSAAAERARTALLRELSSPEGLARALGAEALAGPACTIDDEVTALEQVTPAAVKAAATSLVVGGRLSVRGQGPAVGGGS